MKSVYVIMMLSSFFLFKNSPAMEKPSTAENDSSWINSLKFLSKLAIDIVTFTPESTTINTITHRISPDLTIYASENISICRGDLFFKVEEYTRKQNKTLVYYFDPTLRGCFRWQNGHLINKKGNVVNPLI